MNLLRLALLSICVLFSVNSFGQSLPDTLKEYPSPTKFSDYTLYNNLAKNAISNFRSNPPVDVIGEELPYPIPGFPFTPSPPYQNIGDVNGDGITDYFQQNSLIYFGKNSIELQPDQSLKQSRFLGLGDMNGDGYADGMEIYHFEQNTLYQGSENGFIEVANPDFQDFSVEHFRNNVQTNLDINKDGYSDIISSYVRTFGTYAIRYQSIVYGHPDIFEDGFSAHSTLLTNNAKVTASGDLIKAFTINEELYFVFESCEKIPVDEFSFENRTSVEIFIHNEHDSLTYINGLVPPHYNFHSECRGYPEFFAEDINNDSFIDIVYVMGNDVFVQPGTGIESDTLIFESNLTGSSDDFLITGVPYLHLLGDIDGDNIPEFYVLKDLQTKLEIGNFSKSEGMPVWNKLLTVNSEDFLPGSYFTSRGTFLGIYNTRYSAVGISPDGNLRVPFGVTSDSSFQKGFFEFDPSLEDPFSEYEIVSKEFHKKDFSRIKRKELFYLGDLEDDGIDNFAVWEERWDGEYIVTRNGFYDSDPKTYPLPDTLFLKTLTAGNFTDSEVKQLALLYTNGRNRFESSKGYIFLFNEDSESHTPDQVVELDFDVQLMSVLGDINNDGFDDIGISSPLGSRKIQIYKGGVEISDVPNFEINADEYTQAVNSDVPISFWGVTLLQSIGDINNDGFDDFVFSDPNRAKYYDLVLNKYTYGSIYLFYGKGNDSLDFSIPDFEFFPDTSNFVGESQLFGGLNEIAIGDFNGDGFRDFAAKSFYHRNADKTDGTAAINYFFGKENNMFSALPDTAIPIRFEYVWPSYGIAYDFNYSTSMGRALLKAIDTNMDGSDELLLVPNYGFKNAILYEVKNSPTEYAYKIFEGFDEQSLSPAGGYIDKQYNSLVGDFVGDGGSYFLGNHLFSEYRDTPIMLFDLVNSISVSNEIKPEIPQVIELNHNYPNPFNPSTVISFSLPKADNIQLIVYNLLGQKVATLVNEKLSAGIHSITFNAGALSSGVYFYRLEADNFTETRKMTLIK